MWKRIVRAFKALFGSAISAMEDPAAILEQNIRDMNDQVPKMNENIAMVKANVTLLERDVKKLDTTEKELVSKIKAGIQAGRDDIAANYAMTLEQVKSSKTRSSQQLIAAKQSYEKAMEVKKAFLREKEKKTSEAMRAIQQAKQAKWQSKVADAMGEFQVGGIDQTHDEMITRIEQEAAVNEAKMDMALDSVDTDKVKIEEEADKLRGMDLVNQMKMDMGLMDTNSISQEQKGKEKA